MVPSPVADDAVKYLCFSCYAEIVFHACPDCGFQQSIPARWRAAFTCGKCGGKVAIPHRRTFSTSARARSVKGYGYVYPKF
jgi:rRNA maturation protein Nop10